MASPATARNPFALDSVYHRLLVALAVVCALALGIAVGQGRWIVVAGLVCIPVVLRWPVECALGAFSALVLFESGAMSNSSGGRAVGYFIGAGSAGILLATAAVRRRLQMPPKAALWWTLMVAWGALTVLWAIDPQTVLQRMPTAFALLVLYLAVVSMRLEEREFGRVVWMLILAGGLAAAYSVSEFYRGIGYHAFGPVRGSLVIAGSVVNPDLFATRLMLPLALAVAAFFVSKGRLLKTLILGVCGVLILATLLTQSRAALLALLVITAVFMLRLGVNVRILAVCAAVGGLMMMLPAQFFSRIHEASATRGAGRLDIWHVGAQILKHFGLFGAGLSNFPMAYTAYAGYAPQYRGEVAGAHNIYLQTAVESGAVGLLLFLLALRSQVWLGKQYRSHPGQANIWLVACEAAGWALIVSAFFADLMWEKTFWLTWMILALGTQVYSQAQATKSQNAGRLARPHSL